MANNKETFLNLTSDKRQTTIYGLPADGRYRVEIEAFRVVDQDIDADGVIESTVAVAPASPYQPSPTVSLGDGVLSGGTPIKTVVDALKNNGGQIIQVKELLAGFTDLTATFGNTATSKTNADAAEAAKLVAQLASTNATKAYTDSQAARDAAQSAQGLAAGSATNANTSAANAAQAKLDAQSARDAAQAASVLANGYNNQAANNSNSAAQALSAAQTARDASIQKAAEAAASASNANGSATTASGQATIATQKASDAGQSASIATAKADIATTKAGEAVVSSQQASTSASNALGSANAASASQTVSASNATAANARLAESMPSQMNATATGWTSNDSGSPTSVGPVSPTIITLKNGRYGVEAGSGGYVRSVQVLPATAGTVYEITAEVEVNYSAPGNPQAASYYSAVAHLLDQNYTYVADRRNYTPTRVSGTFTGSVRVSDVADPSRNIQAWTLDTKWIRIGGGWGQDVAGSGGRTLSVRVRDITAELNSTKSATAAAGSASTAAAAQTAAGQSATAAQASETRAATEAGKASVSSASAATSQSNALGYSNSAATSAGVSASAALDAAGAAVSGNSSPGAAPSLWTGAWSALNPTPGSSVADFVRTAPTQWAIVNGRLRVSNNAQAHIGPTKATPYIKGHRYRWTRTSRGITTTDAGDYLEALCVCFDKAGTYLGYSFLGGPALTTTADTTVTYTFGDGTLPTDIILLSGADQATRDSIAWFRPVTIARGAGTDNKAVTEVIANFVVDVESELISSAAATAASTSASSAAASQTAAGQSASAAKTSETNANTSAGTASTKATEASTSASNALGSANSASTSQIASASSASQATQTVASAMPSDFSQGDRFWMNGFQGNSDARPIDGGWTFPTVAGEGVVAQSIATGSRDISHRSVVPLVFGRKYRATVRAKGSSAQSGLDIYDITVPSQNGISNNTPLLGQPNLTTSFADYTYDFTPTAGRDPYQRILARTVSRDGTSQTIQVSRISLADVTDVVTAQTAATASAGSASLAKTSETNAGSSASAALASQTAASTSAGSAKTFSEQASSSASDALGSKNSASLAQGVAATSAAAASASSKSTVPDNFTDPNNWQAWNNWGGLVTFANGLANIKLGGSFVSNFSIPVATGETYRITARHRTINQGGGSTYIGTVDIGDSGNGRGNAWWIVAKGTAPVGTWETTTFEVSASQIYGQHGPVSSIGISFLTGYSGTSDAEVSLLRIENITSEKAARDQASASASSASSAAASKTGADQSASAANTSKTDAQTAAGNASTFAGQAATSASNASGSANTASTQAGLASTAKTAAETAKSGAEGAQTAAAGSASAANTSAGVASSSATAAGTSANAANQSKIDAQAANGAALASATAANTSAVNANASASAASTSATLSSSFASSAVTAVAPLIPSKFAEGKMFWRRDWNNGPSRASDLDANTWTFVNGGAVFYNPGAGNPDIAHLGAIPFRRDRKYRLTAKWLTIDAGGQTSVSALLYVIGMDGSYTSKSAPGKNVVINSGETGWGDGPNYSTATFDLNNADMSSEVVFIRGLFRISQANGSQRFRLESLTIEDVTAETIGAKALADSAVNTASISTLSDTVTNGLGSLATRANTLEAKVASAATSFIVVSTGAAGSGSRFAGLYTAAGVRIGNVPTRSYNLFVKNPNDDNWFSQNYDIYGDANARASMAGVLQNIARGQIVVVTTYDEPNNGHTDAALVSGMQRCGAGPLFTSPNFRTHGAYILVGTAGGGYGSGSEYYAGSTDTNADAYLEKTFSKVGNATDTGGAGLAVRDLTARVSTTEGALVTLGGRNEAYLVQDVSAGNGRAIVSLRANGVAGSSNIDLAASRIRLINSSGGILSPTLSVQDGNVSISGDLYMGTGRIVSKNGNFMKVQGSGFGSSNQFLEWYGPTKSTLDQCTEALAITYLRKDGQAYFGGMVAEGQLRTIKTTYDNGNSQITNGPLVTNGKPRTWTAALSVTRTGTRVSTYAGPSGWSATFVIEQLVDGNWVQRGDVGNLVGYTYQDPNNGVANANEPSNFTQTATGSQVFVDNSGGTDPFQVRARITSISTPGPSGSSGSKADQYTQILSINTYEV